MTSPLPQPTPRTPLEPMPRKVIALVVSGIALFTAGLVLWLWWAGTAGLSGKDLVTARLDALRTGLSIGLGSGGVFALYLAWRRQHSTEVGLAQKERDQEDVARAYQLQADVAEHNRQDAADRRVTELYTKASEQLGSEKAPVRLAGIYALERLAQDNPEHRQTIVSLWCAYLRMPYEPAGDVADADHRDRVQELEVRRTAQQVIISHLKPDGGARFWGEGIDLELSGATLVDVGFNKCHFGDAIFTKARFVGDVSFESAAFAGSTSFAGAVFEDYAGFEMAEFDTYADFRGAVFYGISFSSAKFNGGVAFSEAKFLPYDSVEPANYCFVYTNFGGGADFEGVVFEDPINFGGATGGTLKFWGATFGGVASFKDVENDLSCAVVEYEGYVFGTPARASTDDAVTLSTWPAHWVIDEDGVITHRPVEMSASS